MNVRSNMLLFFFLSFFSVCMYDLAYIMHNHVLFLLFFLAIFAKSPARGASNAQHTCKCLCARIPQCVCSCVCLFVCVHCVMCMYGWSAALSIILKLSLHLWWVGPSRCCAALRCLPTTTTARTLCAQLLTKADCSADAQRTAA